MRTVKQPGIGPAERIQWVEARGTPVAGDLEAGLPLLEAVRRIFAAHRCTSGVVRLGSDLGAHP